MRMPGAKMVVESLKREGVEVVFGYPGGTIMPFFDFLHREDIRMILNRHEQGAVHAADGYARASGKVHHRSGPGGHDRERCFPRGGYHRHLASHHQTQLPRAKRGRYPENREGGLPHCQNGAPRPGPHRSSQGCERRRPSTLPERGAPARSSSIFPRM
jgi:hypothetical protein